MCEFKSAIITKKDFFCYMGIDSHEDIRYKAGLKKDDFPVKFVRLEYVPDWTDVFNYDKWTFRVDQDILPDWFDPDYAKSEFMKWIKKNVREGRKIKVSGSLYLRGCTLPEGIKLPDRIGGSLYLSGCKNIDKVVGIEKFKDRIVR